MATLIGSTSYQSTGSGALTPSTAPSVTVTDADQAIMVWIQQEGALVRTFSVTSSLDGALDLVAYENPSTAVGCWVARDASVGTHTLSVVASATGVGFGSSAQVVEDLGTETPVTDTQFAASNGTSHVSGATGASTSTAAWVLCVCALSGAVTTKTAGSGFTLIEPSATSPRLAQYQNFVATISAEQGAFTTTGTNRANRGLIVAFPVAPSGGSPSSSGGGSLAWFG